MIARVIPVGRRGDMRFLRDDIFRYSGTGEHIIDSRISVGDLPIVRPFFAVGVAEIDWLEIIGRAFLADNLTDRSFVWSVVQVAVNNEALVRFFPKNRLRVQSQEMRFAATDERLILGNVASTFQVSANEMKRKIGGDVDRDIEDATLKIVLLPCEIEGKIDLGIPYGNRESTGQGDVSIGVERLDVFDVWKIDAGVFQSSEKVMKIIQRTHFADADNVRLLRGNDANKCGNGAIRFREVSRGVVARLGREIVLEIIG